MIERGELELADFDETIGTLEDERWRVLVKALGNMMDSDCEPV
jgi:hypothetical protein